MEQTFFIVKYNDNYGNGDDTSIETLVKSKEDFYHWLEKDNDNRKNLGESEYDEDDFDLIPITLYNPSN